MEQYGQYLVKQAFDSVFMGRDKTMDYLGKLQEQNENKRTGKTPASFKLMSVPETSVIDPTTDNANLVSVHETSETS